VLEAGRLRSVFGHLTTVSAAEDVNRVTQKRRVGRNCKRAVANWCLKMLYGGNEENSKNPHLG
jgi:hypothetical protein